MNAPACVAHDKDVMDAGLGRSTGVQAPGGSRRRGEARAFPFILELSEMIRLALAGAAFAAFAAFPAAAQPPAGGPPAAAAEAPEGPMTRAQMQQQIQERFTAMDANHDGFVTATELGDRGPQMMDRLDTNKDGKLTLEELSGPMLARFDRADANHDGTVTPEERDAYREAMRARMQQQGAPAPAPQGK